MESRGALARGLIAVAMHGNHKDEFAAVNTSGGEVLAAPPLDPAIPAVILVARDDASSEVAADDNAERDVFDTSDGHRGRRDQCRSRPVIAKA